MREFYELVNQYPWTSFLLALLILSIVEKVMEGVSGCATAIADLIWAIRNRKSLTDKTTKND